MSQVEIGDVQIQVLTHPQSDQPIEAGAIASVPGDFLAVDQKRHD